MNVCPNCHRTYQMEGHCVQCHAILEKIDSIEKVVKFDCVNKIEAQISKYGCKKVWSLIESNYCQALTRVKVRQLFFKAMIKLHIPLNRLFGKDKNEK